MFDGPEDDEPSVPCTAFGNATCREVETAAAVAAGAAARAVPPHV